MSLISVEDFKLFENTVNEAVEPFAVEIQLMRGTNKLEPQRFLIGQKATQAFTLTQTPTVTIKFPIVLMGTSDADILAGDRFSHNGLIYQIDSIAPDKLFGTLAYGSALE